MRGIRRKLAAGAAVTAALGIASVAFGAIPGANGLISACYDKQSGQMRIYDAAGGAPKGCGKTEAAISWNQQGPKGDTGLQGSPGLSGHEVVRYDGRRFAEEPGIYAMSDTIYCPAGKVALSGGGDGVIVRSDGTTDGVADMLYSHPSGDNGWTVAFGNRDGSELTDAFSLEGVRYEVFIICAVTDD